MTQRPLATLLLLLLFLGPLAGCSSGVRYIFNASSDSRGLPTEVGLAFEEVWFPTSDGLSLHGWYLPGRRPGPLLFYCHGNAANISYRLDILDYFHTRLGLPVFIFDYRGYGSSAGAATAETDLYVDARGALAYLEGRGWKPAQMVYFGRSLGAAIALQMALEQPPAGLVLESAFTSLRDIARRLRPVSYTLFGSWLLGSAYDNLAKIPQLRVPLLIIQGSRDPIVPEEMSARLYARAPQPKQRVLMPGAGHSDSFRVDERAYGEAWDGFLATLPVAANPSPPSQSDLSRL